MSYEPRTGMRVVCVLGAPADLRATAPCRELPIEGRVYTIKRVYNEPEGPYLTFSDCDTKISDELGYISIWYLHSKPLDERRLDVFRAALAPAPKQRERADA